MKPHINHARGVVSFEVKTSGLPLAKSETADAAGVEIGNSLTECPRTFIRYNWWDRVVATPAVSGSGVVNNEQWSFAPSNEQIHGFSAPLEVDRQGAQSRQP
jgi:hypothetical protein